MSGPSALIGPKAQWLQQLDRIEQKLDALIKALAEEDEAEVEHSLDTGAPVARRRDDTQGLG